MATRLYLDHLFGHCSGGYVEARAVPSGHRAWTTVGAWSALGAFVTAAVRAGQNVYVGLATRKTTASGAAENLLEQPAVWADLDCPPAVTRERLARFPFRPSLVVASGAGTHVTWLLREPLDVGETPGALHRAASLQRRLAAALGADPRCTSPAVAPRLVGTLNFKYGAPREVQLLEVTDATVNPSELEDALPVEIARDHAMTIRAAFAVGERNDQLYAIARSLRARGLPFAVISTAIHTLNQQLCEEPLEEDEIRRLLHYALVGPNRLGFVPHPPAPSVMHKGRRR